MVTGKESEQWDHCEKCNNKVFDLKMICGDCDEPFKINIDDYSDSIDRIATTIWGAKQWLK